jgi:DNA-binding NarL/FixJ family response regulator
VSAITVLPATLRVVIVEDHPLMRAAMERNASGAGLLVVGSTGSAAEAYELVGSATPDVVIVDVGLPDKSGVDLTRELLQRNAHVAVVIYTGLEDPVLLKDALGCGARAFAFKTGSPESLAAAVRAAAAGATYVAPELRAAIAHGERADQPRRLTDRERQVLALVAEGITNEAVAAQLMLSSETVRTHIRNAMRKLGTHTRAHAVVEAIRSEEIGL